MITLKGVRISELPQSASLTAPSKRGPDAEGPCASLFEGGARRAEGVSLERK